jgi:hypothetical protein
METTVWVAIVVAFSTLGASFLPHWYLNRKAREDAQRERRWLVRSKPLLDLRDEFAQMATKAARVAKPGKDISIPLEKTKDQEEEALKDAIADWNKYMNDGCLDRVLNRQADSEIVKLVKNIRLEYMDTYSTIAGGDKGWSAVEFGKIQRAAEEQIAPKVAEVQKLINQRLEEL